MASLAFGCLIAAILFGHERQLGFGLIGMGIILYVVDIYIKKRKWQGSSDEWFYAQNPKII